MLVTNQMLSTLFYTSKRSHIHTQAQDTGNIMDCAEWTVRGLSEIIMHLRRSTVDSNEFRADNYHTFYFPQMGSPYVLCEYGLN